MSKPRDLSARRYYRVAFQRYEDGEQLLEIGRPAASVYLTGYAVECILKALLLASTTGRKRGEVLASFRGRTAHDLEGLRDRLARMIGPLPVQVAGHLSLVSSWSTDLRYQPGPGDLRDATAFLTATHAILEWAKRRI
jgi:HEPN domain-containing protein